MRRMRFLVVLAFAALLLPLAAAAAEPFPEHIQLPNGFRPEGIAIGPPHTFYVGSIPTGAVVKGDLLTGESSILVPAQPGRAAIGVAVDQRDRLFVAGGPTGHGYVYDANTGENIADYTLTGSAAFINDVVVTRTAAWFTDSINPFLYRVPIAPDGTLGLTAEAIPLTGDIDYLPGFNLNGIEATPDGRTLVVVQSNTGKLFTVDESGVTTEITGVNVAGDGLLLDGRTLYVVTRSPVDQIVVIKLSGDLSSGTVVGNITSPDFGGPTTIDELGNRIYAVNAQFSVPPTPNTPYWLTQVRK
jgi:sugar lactone lactonase YvrE